MLNHDDEQTASETLDEMGEALKKDADTTVDHVKTAGEWVSDKARDTKDAVENEAEEHGLNDGDPSRNDD